MMNTVQQANCCNHRRCINHHQYHLVNCKLMHIQRTHVGSLLAIRTMYAPADVIQMCLSCLQRITSRNDHPLRSPCYVMTSALAPLVHRFPATPPPPPPASRSATLASLLAEEQFNLYYLLAILFPVITAILGEVGRDHVADLQH